MGLLAHGGEIDAGVPGVAEARQMSLNAAHLARAKGWGYWQAVEYLGDVERKHGTRAALLEIALQNEFEQEEERQARRSGSHKGRTGRR